MMDERDLQKKANQTTLHQQTELFTLVLLQIVYKGSFLQHLQIMDTLVNLIRAITMLNIGLHVQIFIA